MASKLYYWLVGQNGSAAKGDLITGGPSKVVVSATKPSGYNFTQQIATVGDSKATVFKALAAALPGLPTGIRGENSYNIPGLGTAPVSGPGGAAGVIDQTVTTAGNATSTVAQALAFLTSGQNWLRLGEVLAGALLLLFGLITLSGGSAGGAAKKAAMVAL